MMKKVFTFLLAALVASSLFAQNVGETPPDFSLKNLSENDYVLSESKGKVVLVFFVGYNCSFCVAAARTIKTEIVDVYKNNDKFEAVVIDTWDGNKNSVQGFKNTTKLDAQFLQQGSNVASSWKTTYDRLFVIDASGKVAFKGTKNARSQTDLAKAAVEKALNDAVTSVSLSKETNFELSQNYPNPVTAETKISFSLPSASNVRLSIFDVTGKLAAIPLNAFRSKGKHEIVLDGSSLKKGIYLYRLQTEEHSAVKRMIVQ